MARLSPDVAQPANPSAQVRERMCRVRLLILDVDGVLTDGRLYYGPDGQEIKAFNALDGSAMKRLMAAGLHIAIISGRTSAAVDRRAKELGIPHLYAGVEDKTVALADLCARSGIDAEHMAHVGDDLPDVALFEQVGMAIAVPNGHPAVVERADYVTQARGGEGAVREVCDFLLACREP